jgi:hypothetical protein
MFYSVRKFVSYFIVEQKRVCKSSRATYIAYETVVGEVCLIIPISGPTDETCDRFLFSIYMCITLHVSSVKRSSSGVSHRTCSLQFLELKLF